MKKPSPKKLTVKQSTLRELSDEQARRAVGGADTTTQLSSRGCSLQQTRKYN